MRRRTTRLVRILPHVWYPLMDCVSHRVRLLGYAGIPLLFAIPSFLLSCFSSMSLISNRHTPSRASPSPLPVPSHKATPRDSFTTVPIRRERPRLSTLAMKRAAQASRKRASMPVSELDTPASPGPQTPATTVFDPHPEVHELPEPRTASATPPGLEQMIYLVPSRTPSDPTRTSVGRAPISPVVARHSRHYHLPFSWRTASTFSLPIEQDKEASQEKELESGHEREANGRPSRSTRSQSRSPTPLSFLPTMTPSSTRTSPELPAHVHAHLHVFPKLMYGQPSSSTFLAELGGDGGYGVRREEHDVFWDEETGAFFYDDGDDGGLEDDIETVSGSMHWARPSFASDETKSPELEFAHRPSTGSGPVMYTCTSLFLLAAHICLTSLTCLTHATHRPQALTIVEPRRHRACMAQRRCMADALLPGFTLLDADTRRDHLSRGHCSTAEHADAVLYAACRVVALRVGTDDCIRCASVAAARLARPHPHILSCP